MCKDVLEKLYESVFTFPIKRKTNLGSTIAYNLEDMIGLLART